jgi:hypothetical protein
VPFSNGSKALPINVPGRWVGSPARAMQSAKKLSEEWESKHVSPYYEAMTFRKRGSAPDDTQQMHSIEQDIKYRL